MFAIRRAIDNDQQVILDLWTQLIEYHRSIEAFRPERWKIPPEEAIRPLLTAAWEDPKNRAAFVAETEGRALGFVYTELKEAGHCPGNINALFVRGDERTHGAGQALLDAGLKWCRRKGANQISLDCIWPNDIARRFYEKRGFRPLLITYVLQLESDAETRIRAAVAADVAEVARIVEDAYRHYIPRMGKPPGPMLDDYSARISEEVVWVIEEGMNMVGILMLLPRPGHLLLDNIAVSPSRQGLGFGRRLLDFAEAEALRRGYREIQLYTHQTMVENQQLYTAIGYEEIGRGTEKGYARVHMRKQLRA
jgi:GNAT superfamily N-acetyltransferase